MDSAEAIQDETGTTAVEAAPEASHDQGPVDAATGAPAPTDVKITKTSHRLKVEMTLAERDAVNDELLGVLDELELVKARKKTAMATFKETEEGLTERLVELRQKLRSRGEWTDVPCEMRSYFATGTVHVVREDTAEIIHTRAMTAEERQIAMFGDYVPPPTAGSTENVSESAEGSAISSASNEEAKQADLAEDGHPPADDPGWDTEQDDGDTEGASGSQVVTNGDTTAPGLVVHDGGKAQSSRKRGRRSSDRAAE